MKLFLGLLLLATSAIAQSSIAGSWQGVATVHDQQVPIRLEITGNGNNLHAALRNGSESSPASSAVLTGNHLLLTFDYFAKTLDATFTDGHLAGSFGTPVTRYPIDLRAGGVNDAGVASPAINGDWEIAVKSAKGESAWQLHVEPVGASGAVRAVIQRIDGDTGSLFGSWTGKNYRVSHFTAAGPALYSLTPQDDGTLWVSNLLRADQQNLVARRPAQARAAKLVGPTDPAEQTTVKDPAAPFRFSFPDLQGKVVSNTDPQFDGKVVIVAIGGSWCPNCHDEAPFLVSLYKKFHSRGLEIVDVDFEQGDPDTDTKRLNAFIAHYGIPYPVLVGGTTDQLDDKFPQAVNLNCWPTSFFIGRDGLVKETHAGFAGPGNTVGHAALEHDVTALVEKLLAERAPTQTASLAK